MSTAPGFPECFHHISGKYFPAFCVAPEFMDFLKNQHTMKDGFRTIVAGAGAYKLGGG